MSIFDFKLIDFFIFASATTLLCRLPTFNTAMIPELALAAMLAYLLVVIAIELGNGRSKKTLTFEALNALHDGIGYVIILYAMHLILLGPETLFNGYAHVNAYVYIFKILVAITARSILLNSEQYIKDSSHNLLEYPLVLSLALLFMLFLVGSSHLISAFVSLVGFSLNLYVLVLFDAPHAMAREAGVKYFYLSAFSSGLMLYGIFLIFFTLGTGQFHEMNQVISTNSEILTLGGSTLHCGLAFLLVGIFFKLSAFPGHLWAAEVYEGSPDPVMAFFMLPVKVAVLTFTVQLLVTGMQAANALWQPLIAMAAVGSLVWGCLGAFVEKKTKRFLAYASINQIGFLLLGLATGSFEGYRATLLYLFIYAVMNIGFLVVFLNTRRQDGYGMLYLTDFRGLGQRHWLLSWSMAMILLSMAGIPPLAGFFGKYYLLLHAQEQGLYGLVITGLVTSLISTYYYLRVIKIFWFEGEEAVTEVTCDLTEEQSTVLFVVEGVLWSFIIFAGAIMAQLTVIVNSLLTTSVSSITVMHH